MNLRLIICALAISTFMNLSVADTSVNDQAFIDSAASNGMDMLSQAFRKYSAGEITKDQFLIICTTAAKMADYSSKTKNATVKTDAQKESIAKNNEYLQSPDGKAATAYADGYNQWVNKNKTLNNRMFEDYKSYFRKTKPGDIGKMSNGTLYRLDNQRALFVGLDGSVIIQEEWQNNITFFNEWASRNEYLAREWKNNYGFVPFGENRSANTIQVEQELKKYLDLPMDTRISLGTPDWLIQKTKWSAEQYNSLKRGESKKWNEYTIVRGGSQNVLYIINRLGEMAEVHGRVEYNSSTLDPNSFFTKFAKQYWGLKI